MANKLDGVREYIYSSPFLLNIQKRDRFMSASYYITGINQNILLNFEEDPNKYVSSEFIINNINVKKRFNKALYKSYYLLSTTLNTTLFDDETINILDVLISEDDYTIDTTGAYAHSENNSETLPHLFNTKEDFYIYLIKSYMYYQEIESSEELTIFENGIIPFMKLEGSYLGSNGLVREDAINTANIILNYNENDNFLRSHLGENKITELNSSDTTNENKEKILKDIQALMNTQLFFERFFYIGDDFTRLYEDEINFTYDKTFPIKNYIIDWSHDFRETTENGFVYAKNLDRSFISYVPSITFKNVITRKVSGSDSARKILGYVDMDLCSYNLNEGTFTFQGIIETLESFNSDGNLEMSYGIHRLKYFDSGVPSDGLLVSSDNKYSYYNNKIDIKITNSDNNETWSFDIAFPEDGLYFTLGLMVNNEIVYGRQMFGNKIISDDGSISYSGGIVEKTISREELSYDESLGLVNPIQYTDVIHYKITGSDTDGTAENGNMSTQNKNRNNMYLFFREYKKYEAFDTGFDLINEKLILDITTEDRKNTKGRLSTNRVFFLGSEFEDDRINDVDLYNPSYYCLTNTYETAEEVRFFRSLNELLHSNVIVRNNYTSTGGEAELVSETAYNAYNTWLNDSESDSETVISEFKNGQLTDHEHYKAWLADQNFVLVESVPVVGSEFYNKNDDNQNYIEEILYNYYSSIKDNLDAIEGNFDIDMKFYNSYGPSKLLKTNKNNSDYFINKTNIALSFSVKLETGTTLDEVSFRRSIVDYVNSCNSVREINMYIFKLVSQLQTEYTNILYIQYNGMPNLVEGVWQQEKDSQGNLVYETDEEGNKIPKMIIKPDTVYPNYQLITYTSNEITTEQDIIPEYLTIDRKTNENNVTELVPNIIINYL